MTFKIDSEIEIKLYELEHKLKFESKAHIARLAISYSIKQKNNTFEEYNHKGFEYKREVLYGESKALYNAMIQKQENKYINEKELDVIVLKHLNRGIELIHSEWIYSLGDKVKFIQSLEK